MADASAQFAVHETLAADVLDTVTLKRGRQHGLVEVYNHGETGGAAVDKPIFFRPSGDDFALGDDDTYVVPPGQARVTQARALGGAVTVKVRGSVAVDYSVTLLD